MNHLSLQDSIDTLADDYLRKLFSEFSVGNLLEPFIDAGEDIQELEAAATLFSNSTIDECEAGRLMISYVRRYYVRHMQTVAYHEVMMER